MILKAGSEGARMNRRRRLWGDRTCRVEVAKAGGKT